MEDKYDDFYDDMRAKAESQARKMLKWLNKNAFPIKSLEVWE